MHYVTGPDVHVMGITLLYDRLIRIQSSPVVELDRAVAIAMYEGPEQGLCLIDDLPAREELANCPLETPAVRICVAGQGRIRRPVLRMRSACPDAAGARASFPFGAARGIETKN